MEALKVHIDANFPAYPLSDRVTFSSLCKMKLDSTNTLANSIRPIPAESKNSFERSRPNRIVDGQVQPSRGPRGHPVRCMCVLCDACAELLVSMRAGRVNPPGKAKKIRASSTAMRPCDDTIPDSSLARMVQDPGSVSHTESSSVELSQSLSKRHERSVSCVHEEKTEYSRESRLEKTTVLSDGSVLTEVDRSYNSQSRTIKLEQRSVETVEIILKVTNTRTEDFRRDYIQRVISCDVYNPHSLVILQAHLESLLPKPVTNDRPIEVPVDPSLTPRQQMEKQREYNFAYMRQRDRDESDRWESRQQRAKLEHEMYECVQCMSGSSAGSSTALLDKLHAAGNRFAEHLKDLKNANNDEARRALNPRFMEAVEDMTPLRLMCAKTDAKEIDRRFNNVRVHNAVGHYQDPKAPYINDRLVVPVEAFAPPLATSTLALLVRQMMRENRSVERDLTGLVRDRLHANGVMTVVELTGAMKSFAQSLLLAAHASHVDMQKIDIIWTNADRMFFDTVHFLEEYVPILEEGGSNITGLTIYRPATNPITDHMTEIDESWRKLKVLREFRMVGLRRPPRIQRRVMFDDACDGADTLLGHDGPDDSQVQLMKEMPLNVHFGGVVI